MTALVELDPFREAEVAAQFEHRATEFGAYRLYAEHERVELDIGPGFYPRHDAVQNFLRTRVTSDDTVESIGTRTSYFREEYAYGENLLLDGVEAMRSHEGLIDAARSIHGRPVIEPAIVYANLFLPGQELAVHTDVPEFRGLNRKLVPQWLLVVMHHSGLFDAWRLPIATGIAWFGASEGGDLVYWPDGPDGAAARIRGPAQHRRGARHRQRLPRRRAGRTAGCRGADARAGLRARRGAGRQCGPARRDAGGGAAVPTGKSCGSRSRGRRTASPTTPSA